MTIDEAIEIKENFLDRHFHIMSQEEILADKLGIEALTAYAEARRLGLPLRCTMLPSETKD